MMKLCNQEIPQGSGLMTKLCNQKIPQGKNSCTSSGSILIRTCQYSPKLTDQ